MQLTQSRLNLLLWLLFATFVIGTVSLPGLLNLRLSNDFKVYFSEDNPQLSAFDEFEQEFASHDSLALVIQHQQQSWLTPNGFAVIEQLTDEMWRLPYVTRVNSLTNYQYTYSEDDTLFTSDLAQLVEPFSGDEFASSVRQALDSDPQIRGVLLSANERVTIIQADIRLPTNEAQAPRVVYEAYDQLKRSVKSLDTDIIALPAGSVVSNITLEEAVKGDLILLVPLSYLVIILGLLYFLRSIRGMLLVLAIVTASIGFTFAIYSWFSTQLTPVAGFVPSIVMTLAVADCVHYLTSYRYLLLHERLDHEAANRRAFEINFTPITITSVTTAIGVLCLNFSDSPPYQDLGNMVAIGVMLAWIFSVALLPWVLKHWPLPYSSQQTDQDLHLLQLSRWVKINRKPIFIGLSIALVVCTIGLFNNQITENWSKYFSKRFEVAQTIDVLKNEFDRLHRFELVMTASSNDAINDPEYLAMLDKLLLFLQEHPGVKQIQSYGQIIKRLNQNMHNDAIEYYRMPESQALAAQYLLLYELSLPQGLGADAWVNFDRSATRTSVMLEPSESHQLIEFEEELMAYFASLDNPNNYQLSLSGLDNIFAHIASRNINSMLIGSAVALVIISLLMMVILRSVAYGAISLIPNLMPALMAYGIWGFTAGFIDLALSIVICMSLGIVVDDSVHFMTKYLRAKRELQKNCSEALDYAFQIVGKALVTTTVILVGGFSVLVFSPLAPTANTGALISITLAVALVIDFLLLPIILYWKDHLR